MRSNSTNEDWMSRKRWMSSVFAFLLVLQVMTASAQGRTVSGVVTSSEDGSTLPGVTILEQGTTNGTITDIDGNYTINVPEDAVLTFSFVGFQNMSVPVNGRQKIDAALLIDVTALEEVVVTGYGAIKRADLATAHTSLGAKELEKTVNTTVEQAIQGRAAGVYVTQNTGQPGGGISVNIRGVNSINGNTEPLYVIDGVQIQGSQVEYSAQSSSNPLSGLNPSDIASMEILTGPVATALYGSRATNGVIVITTKRGRAGEIKINYGYQFSYQAQPNTLEVMNLPEYARMSKEYHDIAGGDTPTEFLDPSLLGEGTDWQDELFNGAAMQKHQLSFRGGGDKTQYYLSGEYMNQDGVALGSGFERYSVRVNLDNQPKKWLSIGANANYNQTDQQLVTGQENLISTALQMSPNIPVKNFDGSYAGGDVGNNSSQQFLPPNPIGLSKITTNEQIKRQLLGGLNFTFKIIEGLTFTNSFNGNVEYTQATYYLPAYQFGYQENPVGTLSERVSSSNYWNWNQLAQYQKSYGKHNINVMGSHEAQQSNWKNVSAGVSEFVTDAVIDLNLGNIETATIGGGKGSWAMESYLARVNYNYDDRYLVMAAFRADGSANFGANNKWGYFPSASVAWRISNEPFFNIPFVNELRLRVESGLTGNQGGSGYIYGTLSSVNTPWGTGFALSRYANPNLKWEETFTNNIGLDFSILNDRFQVELDYYIKKTDNLLIEAANPWYMGVSGSGSIGNPFVNLGSLENHGWTVMLKSTNIATKDFTWTTDVNLSAVNTEITSLSTESGFYSRTSWWMNDWTQRAAVGEAPWLFYGYETEGLFQSQEDVESSALPVDNNGDKLPFGENSIYVGDVKYKDISGPEGVPDGVIDTYDQTYIGNPWPKMFAGLTNTFSYKGISLSILVTGVYGNDIYNYTAFANTNPNNINLSRNMLVGALDYAKVGMDEENNPYLLNPGTDIPRITVSDQNQNYTRHSSRFVEDGSYIRVKNITLSYSLPRNLLAKVGFIQSVNVGFSAQNVATFTKYTGYDPEVGSYVGRDVSATNQAIGVDNGRYPLTRVYSFSLGIDF